MRLSPIVQAPRTRQQLHNVIGRYYDPFGARGAAAADGPF